MSRILLLIVMVLWMSRSGTPRGYESVAGSDGTALFLGGLALVVMLIALWSRRLARSVRGSNFHRSLRWFHKSTHIARVVIPIWFGVAIFWLGWGESVDRMLGPVNRYPVQLPGLLLGTAPVFITWMALWWAQFPADRALREQNTLAQLEEGLPLHAPPGFWSYFTANLRLQLLFTVVPVALIIFVHDVASMGTWAFTRIDIRGAYPGTIEARVELVIQLASLALVVLFAPEVLRRILHTQRLPDSPLRSRLEELCRRTHLRYRDIMLWRTNHAMGNAMVMGLIPRMRYILLSDVLLETMSDRQIEAVFAHEVGHVKHWHMGWYVVLVLTLLMLLAGPGQIISDQVDRMARPGWLSDDIVAAGAVLIGLGTLFLVFGYFSRWFERQADVYAARMIEQDGDGMLLAMANPDNPATAFAAQGVATAQPAVATSGASHVGPRGAAIFASALHRVAVVNNIPISARNFTHGSIAQRMRYLETLSSDPARTLQFDRVMQLLYGAMLVTLCICGGWVLIFQGV